MIKNDRQYRVTKSEADKFTRAIRELESSSSSPASTPDVFRIAEIAALRSQLADLQTELADYDRLRSGKELLLATMALDEIPQTLVKARIAAGLTQKDLAGRLGIKEQQIQKYEATDYAGASVTRLLEVAKALNLKVRDDIFLASAGLGSFDLFARFAEIGIEKKFVLRRLVSQSTALTASGSNISSTPEVIFEATAAASRIFGWTPEAIVGGDTLFTDQGVLGAARFKVNKRAEQKRLSAYTFYAHYLALQLLNATPTLPSMEIPTDYRTLRANVISSYGVVEFVSVLNYVWDLGVVVLPLKDPGAFHGAAWRIRGRNVLVLKQATMSIDRWLHDLLHELFHSGQEPDRPERTTIEASETSTERRESDEEWDATQFAADVVLGGRAEELAKRCVDSTKTRPGQSGAVERLKAAVPQIAKSAAVPTGALANYMAFRLSQQGIDWWGSAHTLQDLSTDPWLTARDVLLQRADLGRVNSYDRNLLLRAISDSDL